LIEQDKDGVYIMSCPTFKACHSYGKTVDEGLSNFKEVIEMCLEEENRPQINQFIGFREWSFYWFHKRKLGNKQLVISEKAFSGTVRTPQRLKPVKSIVRKY